MMQQPVMQQPVQPVMQQPVQPVMQQPVQPVMQQPVQPVMQQPVQPVMQQPVQPVMQQPVQPAMEQPTFTQPIQSTATNFVKPNPQSGPMRASTYPGPQETVQQTVQPNMQQQPAYNPAFMQPPMMKKKKTGLIIGIVAAILVIAIAVTVLLILKPRGSEAKSSANSTPEDAVSTLIDGMNERNFNKMTSVLTEPEKNSLLDYYGSAEGFFNETLGIDRNFYTIDYIITSTSYFGDEGQMLSIEDSLAEYGYRYDITDYRLYTLEITLTLIADPSMYDSDILSISAIKIDGKWYLYDVGL